jgi:hypothetical protein
MNDTPETDALLAADLHHLEDDETCPVSAYWRMNHLCREMERQRNEKTWLAMQFAGELAELRNAIRNLRDVNGRHHTQQALEHLISLLPESKP